MGDYASAIRAAERVAWKLDDVLPDDAEFSFERRFLPEALVSADALGFLGERERRTLNQIRAHGYLCMFGLVEEFILPFVLERLQSRAKGKAEATGSVEMDELRALLGFAGEEAKHIELFRRFRRVFERGFGHACAVIGPPSSIAEHVLGHGQLGVGLLILHIEWMSQRHYVEMARDDSSLSPPFRELLHQHWLEESQHARIDGWIVESVAAESTEAEREAAFRDYVALLSFFDAGLVQQVELDLEALERAVGRTLSERERSEFRAVQHKSQQRAYLGAGVGHPRVRAAVQKLYPSGVARLDELSRAYA